MTGSNLWYLVGLITSDGCLSNDGRHIDITSSNYSFLKNLKNSLGLTNKIGVKNKDRINEAHCLVFSNRNLYEFLLSIGLTQRKSLTLDKVDIPDEFFHDFLRGLIDGDGSIRKWIHPSNKREQWSLRIYSCSASFTEWLQKSIERVLRAKGRVHREKRKKPRAELFVLKYGKIAAKAVFSKCYYKNALAMSRKAKLADECRSSYTGWAKSKTVFN